MKKFLEVTSATYAVDYKINITFSDGFESLVDFHSFLNSSLNPLIKKYLDLKIFKSFQVKNGQLMWGDYDLIFPVQDFRRVLGPLTLKSKEFS